MGGGRDSVQLEDLVQCSVYGRGEGFSAVGGFSSVQCVWEGGGLNLGHTGEVVCRTLPSVCWQ